MLQGLGRFRPQPGRLILPDICCDVTCVGGRQFLTGPMTSAREARHVGEDVLLLQVAPVAARQLFGVPIAELTDRVIPLDEVNRSLARTLAERLETNRVAELVRPCRAESMDRRFAVAASALGRGCTVYETATQVALSERQLERLVYEHAGMAPKLFARVSRLRRTVMAARAGTSLAMAAAAYCYADQAHFSRETRELTGVSPRALLPNVGNLQDLVRGEL
jgi:AraC-like DNA-binding protein